MRLPAMERLSAIFRYLLKWVHYEHDVYGKDLELRSFHDTDACEVDFVVTDHGKPVLLVEFKWSDADVDCSLRYLHGKFLAAEAWQVSATRAKDFQKPDGIRVAPALRLLTRVV